MASSNNRLIFWQPIVSPHILPILEVLAKDYGYNVELYVEQDEDKSRMKLGWTSNSSDYVYIDRIRSISFETVFSYKESGVHIFSGFRGYPKVWEAFQYAIGKDAWVGVISETADWEGTKGKLRYLVGRYDQKRLSKHIKFIMAIGSLGVQWYTKLGYSADIIHPWSYTSALPNVAMAKFDHERLKRLLFVGRLEPSKGLLELVASLNALPENVQLSIVGEGSLHAAIDSLSQTNPRLVFLGQMPMSELPKVYLEHGILILPSISKDGWGVVVNEALQHGLSVITTSYCGSSSFVENNKVGIRISMRDTDQNLASSIAQAVIKLCQDPISIKDIKYASQKLSPETLALELHEVISRSIKCSS